MLKERAKVGASAVVNRRCGSSGESKLRVSARMCVPRGESGSWAKARTLSVIARKCISRGESGSWAKARALALIARKCISRGESGSWARQEGAGGVLMESDATRCGEAEWIAC